MTVSPNKKSKDKRYRVDSGPVFSDRDPALTDVEDDEDAIDRLLVNTGFDTHPDHEFQDAWNTIVDELELPKEAEEYFSKKTSSRKIDPQLKDNDWDSESLADARSASVQPEAVRQAPALFDAIENSGETVLEITPIPVLSDVGPLIMDEFSAKEDFLLEADLFVVPEIQPVNEPGCQDVGLNSKQFQVDGLPGSAESMPSELNRIILEQETIIHKQEQLIEKLEAKTQKTVVLSFSALIVGSIAIVLALVMATAEKTGQQSMTAVSAQTASNDVTRNTGKGSELRNVLGENDLPFEPASGRQHLTPSDRQATPPASIQSKSTWFVNLASFKQRSDAEKQASELIRKGIRTEIIEVKVNDAIWYRLRVGGFNNREQAAQYAEKIKKPLLLNSVWVAND